MCGVCQGEGSRGFLARGASGERRELRRDEGCSEVVGTGRGGEFGWQCELEQAVGEGGEIGRTTTGPGERRGWA
ncbi:MAG: hypothetical protein N2595_10285 [bacterium]|nr:hypothetical protein [bacterium]